MCFLLRPFAANASVSGMSSSSTTLTLCSSTMPPLTTVPRDVRYHQPSRDSWRSLFRWIYDAIDGCHQPQSWRDARLRQQRYQGLRCRLQMGSQLRYGQYSPVDPRELHRGCSLRCTSQAREKRRGDVLWRRFGIRSLAPMLPPYRMRLWLSPKSRTNTTASPSNSISMSQTSY